LLTEMHIVNYRIPLLNCEDDRNVPANKKLYNGALEDIGNELELNLLRIVGTLTVLFPIPLA
jgi:hypothetical protein